MWKTWSVILNMETTKLTKEAPGVADTLFKVANWCMHGVFLNIVLAK